MSQPTQQLECRYTLPQQTLPELTRAVQDTLDDLAYTQVGRWQAHEVRLILPRHLAQDPATAAHLRQQLGHWLTQQGYAWLMLAGSGSVSRLLVRCHPSGPGTACQKQ